MSVDAFQVSDIELAVVLVTVKLVGVEGASVSVTGVDPPHTAETYSGFFENDKRMLQQFGHL